MSPDVSTINREFQALRDQDEIASIQSAVGLAKARHNWLEAKDFTFGLLACQLGEIAFVNTQGTTSTVWRDRVPDDFITISRVNDGGGLISLVDESMDISAGDVFVASAGDAFTAHVPVYQDLSFVSIPRVRLRQLGLPERILRPKMEFAPPGTAADALFDLFHSLAIRAEQGSFLSSRALTSINESIIGMAAATLEENTPATDARVHSMAKAFIDAHLSDPKLSPATVAAALHVSKRTLYRSFADQDQTVASYIRMARLRCVKRELDVTGGAVNIGDAAGRWGFTNRGQFAKLFQQEFGSMPSQYMRNLR